MNCPKGLDFLIAGVGTIMKGKSAFDRREIVSDSRLGRRFRFWRPIPRVQAPPVIHKNRLSDITSARMKLLLTVESSEARPTDTHPAQTAPVRCNNK